MDENDLESLIKVEREEFQTIEVNSDDVPSSFDYEMMHKNMLQ